MLLAIRTQLAGMGIGNTGFALEVRSRAKKTLHLVEVMNCGTQPCPSRGSVAERARETVSRDGIHLPAIDECTFIFSLQTQVQRAGGNLIGSPGDKGAVAGADFEDRSVEEDVQSDGRIVAAGERRDNFVHKQFAAVGARGAGDGGELTIPGFEPQRAGTFGMELKIQFSR